MIAWWRMLRVAAMSAMVTGPALAQVGPCIIKNHYILDALECLNATGSVGPAWVLTGSMSVERIGHTATLLGNGKVIVAGGYSQRRTTYASAELYDPATGNWTLTGSMISPRAGHSATLLFDGRVLVAGGWVTSATGMSNTKTASAELYDPASGTWRQVESPPAGGSHEAVRLQDGRVMITGVFVENDNAGGSGSYLFDPATERWSVTGKLNLGRWSFTSNVLSTGEVLVARGGGDDFGTAAYRDAETYDPASGTWTFIEPSGWNSAFHSSTPLPDGKVLLTGGDPRRPGGGGELAVAEMFDPVNRSWNRVGDMLKARALHTATLTAGGRVIVAGGEFQGTQAPFFRVLASTELFDPARGSWSGGPDLNVARYLHTATALPNGGVLVTGGLTNGGNDPVATAEILGITPLPNPAVIEFRNILDFPRSPGGHYFYSEDAAEVSRVDLGVAGRFARTGRTFKSGGSKPLCRFYGSVTPGPNSHFYTISDDECSLLKSQQAVPAPRDVQQWNYEGLRFAAEPVRIDAAGTSCPEGTLPVYRAYNNAYSPAGAKNAWDSVHRYSTNRVDIEQLVTTDDWRDEGIAFCSLP